MTTYRIMVNCAQVILQIIGVLMHGDDVVWFTGLFVEGGLVLVHCFEFVWRSGIFL
jgi:hypothetical protein